MKALDLNEAPVSEVMATQVLIDSAVLISIDWYHQTLLPGCSWFVNLLWHIIGVLRAYAIRLGWIQFMRYSVLGSWPMWAGFISNQGVHSKHHKMSALYFRHYMHEKIASTVEYNEKCMMEDSSCVLMICTWTVKRF